MITVLFWLTRRSCRCAAGARVVGAAAASGLPWRWPAVVMLVAGIEVVISDYVVNQEDVRFHLGRPWPRWCPHGSPGGRSPVGAAPTRSRLIETRA